MCVFYILQNVVRSLLSARGPYTVHLVGCCDDPTSFQTGRSGSAQSDQCRHCLSCCLRLLKALLYEPPHDKTNKMTVRPV